MGRHRSQRRATSKWTAGEDHGNGGGTLHPTPPCRPSGVGCADTAIPLLKDRPPRDGLATAYVCERFVCGAPVTDAEELAASYGCAEGRMFRHNAAVPFLPWLWIGWFVLTAFAIPARMLAWLRKTQFVMMSAGRRFIWLLIGAFPVWLFGFVFQNRTVDCSRPQEMWGLFEGGVIAIPLLGIFLFVASTSMAMLSAAYVRPLPR